jgi:peptidylprolyl isomerase
VFGEVIEGLDIVNKLDALGSSDGKPKKTVIIADSGTV